MSQHYRLQRIRVFESFNKPRCGHYYRKPMHIWMHSRYAPNVSRKNGGGLESSLHFINKYVIHIHDTWLALEIMQRLLCLRSNRMTPLLYGHGTIFQDSKFHSKIQRISLLRIQLLMSRLYKYVQCIQPACVQIFVKAMW